MRRKRNIHQPAQSVVEFSLFVFMMAVILIMIMGSMNRSMQSIIIASADEMGDEVSFDDPPTLPTAPPELPTQTWVPLPTPTSEPTATATKTSVPTATNTSPPVSTATRTATLPAATNTPPPANTATRTATLPAATNTPPPANTATRTATAHATATRTATASATPMRTATRTPTPTPKPVPNTADDCKDGGWERLYKANGDPFTSQGDCISYANNN